MDNALSALPPSPGSQLPSPTRVDRLWAMLGHFSVMLSFPLLVPLGVDLLICPCLKGNKEYVSANAKEALNFHLSLCLYTLIWVGCCILLLPLIPLLTSALVSLSVIMAWGLWTLALILALVAMVKAANCGCDHYPLTLRLVKEI